ncbi:MAG: ECF transporter S component [Oscillospiraceae bacterium]|nr:ECF transporter S component [Oscillospiraceae bacterium]
MQSKTKKLVLAAMLAALTCVATIVIKIPYPQGYLNLGDAVVLLAGWLLSPLYGFLAAGIGSALADLLSGYVVYAPVTFVIKGAMALLLAAVAQKQNKAFVPILFGFFAELLMVAGYLLFEGVLYGFAAAIANVPFNAIQGAAGLVLGGILIRVFSKYQIVS